MYKKWFFIKKAVWNNVFSFDKRKNKKLYVPALKKISNFSEIKLQKDKQKIAFEDFDFNWKLSTNYGLENFYKIKINGKEIILFDNHNHAFYFWYEARKKGIIKDNSTLIHIDEHSDTRDNNKIISKEESKDLKKVFNFTNFVLNVGDYIIPAQKEWLIGEVIQIRNTLNLENYITLPPAPLLRGEGSNDIILNLDLDFFNPNLDFIDYNLKKKVVRDAFLKAKVITISTSPFFIEQNLALKVFKDLFSFK